MFVRHIHKLYVCMFLLSTDTLTSKIPFFTHLKITAIVNTSRKYILYMYKEDNLTLKVNVFTEGFCICANEVLPVSWMPSSCRG